MKVKINKKKKNSLEANGVQDEQGKVMRKPFPNPPRLNEKENKPPQKKMDLDFDEIIAHTPKKKRPKTGLVD